MLRLNDKFGANLKAARLGANMSQKQLSINSGTGVSSIAAWEVTGKMPSKPSLEKLNAALFPQDGAVNTSPTEGVAIQAKPSKTSVKVPMSKHAAVEKLPKPKAAKGTMELKPVPAKHFLKAITLDEILTEVKSRGYSVTLASK